MRMKELSTSSFGQASRKKLRYVINRENTQPCILKLSYNIVLYSLWNVIISIPDVAAVVTA